MVRALLLALCLVTIATVSSAPAAPEKTAGAPAAPSKPSGPSAASDKGAAPATPSPPHIGHQPGTHAAPEETGTPHPGDELDCRGCHVSKHQGVLRMYGGTGGRGAPAIPSRMFAVRVACVACHATPKSPEEVAQIAGQSFRPADQTCVGCHGDKYRGMVAQWVSSMTRMRQSVAPKLEAMRTAATEARGPKGERARKLLDDAAFNTRFVALARGEHNVFYAADLLRLANGWADEAAGLLGKTPPKTDDRLVRGGYCAALCHEPLRMKLKPTVTFGSQTLPHAKHATELGAACTTCHSAEQHKTLIATPATCSGCHHAPTNDRCESCHRAQSAFYRGEVKAPAPVAPNVMAQAVSCTGCHDLSHKHSREAVARACTSCHEPVYSSLTTEWTRGFDADLTRTAAAIRDAEADVARARSTGARERQQASALITEAKDALGLVSRARPAHNPLAADALLSGARAKAESARRLVSAASTR
jgi:hypothetical protein